MARIDAPLGFYKVGERRCRETPNQNYMSKNRTMDDFAEPLTPEQKARQAAMAEIKDEVGRLRTKLRNELRALKRKRNDNLVPSEQVALDEQIAKKQKEFDDVECVFYNVSTGPELALQKHVKGLVNWDGIMKKHLGNIPAPISPATPAVPPTPTGQAS